MLNFESDYIEGAHPEILEKLVQTNFEQLSGYGEDIYCKTAAEKIKEACHCPNACVRFVSGGTQTNQLVIDSMLKSFEGVIAAKTGHIALHEAGAIEHTGHKVLELSSCLGKINGDELEKFLSDFFKDKNNEFMVYPGMVYISFPTEYGTLYTLEELEKISGICRKYSIPLFIDGARLGYGLVCSECDVSISQLASLCDVFYIGGTKLGALLGEAVVFTKNNEPAHFVNLMKKHGAILAKGRILGIQFDRLFTDNLYFKISENAVKNACILKEGLKKLGAKFLLDSPTNQQFIILNNSKMDELSKKVKFSFWETVDENHSAIRLATSWATKTENVYELLEIMKQVLKSDKS